MPNADSEPKSDSSDHLVVLVHGLWGNPTHFEYLRSSLEAHYPMAHLLVCQSNSGYFTYDGIETCGERVMHEIEDALAQKEKADTRIKRISVVGYSLGGLIARYTVGLLYSNGVFDKVTPVNFTTFASPHLGVRSVKGIFGKAFNFIGSRTVSNSGAQMFLRDKFRDTGRPLLEVMADRESVFFRGLAKFEQRILYANAVNDRTVKYYTASLSRSDPFAETKGMEGNYLKGYEPNVLSYDYPLRPELKTNDREPHKIRAKFRRTVRMAPTILIFGMLFPVALLIYLGMATVQTVNSKKRIKLHLEGKESELYGYYRKLPIFLAEGMQEVVENALEIGAEVAHPGQADVLEGAKRRASVSLQKTRSRNDNLTLDSNLNPSASSSQTSLDKPANDLAHISEYPHLPLTPQIQQMMDSLDSLEWKKFPVWIHMENHSHASIIVRQGPNWGGGEGKTVVRHWLKHFIA